MKPAGRVPLHEEGIVVSWKCQYASPPATSCLLVISQTRSGDAFVMCAIVLRGCNGSIIVYPVGVCLIQKCASRAGVTPGLWTFMSGLALNHVRLVVTVSLPERSTAQRAYLSCLNGRQYTNLCYKLYQFVSQSSLVAYNRGLILIQFGALPVGAFEATDARQSQPLWLILYSMRLSFAFSSWQRVRRASRRVWPC